jgi:hypothetical protein
MATEKTDAVFDLVLYLVSCSRLALEEPTIYGSFRLLEAAARTIASFDPEGTDDFLARQHESIEAGKLQVIERHAEYRAWLDDVLRVIVAEAKRRSAAMSE